ncbi:MAG: hypothetical protein P4M00_15490 [Azospirillaceae bacterium]|nr:hypothetical protein [Azospirillaceae bacterium]
MIVDDLPELPLSSNIIVVESRIVKLPHNDKHQLLPYLNALYGISIILYVWLMANVTLVAIPEAGYDDALFVRHAGFLLGGHWLGPYDNLTLAKGPFYSVWIALSWITGLPILVTQAIVYALSVLILIRGLKPWLPSEITAFAVFLILLFNPASYSMGQLRVMREGIYVPMTVLIFALFAWWFRWHACSLLRRSGLALGLGVVVGLYWCTREEGVWIVPSFAIIFVILLLRCLDQESGPLFARFSTVRPALVREVALIMVAIGSAFLVVSGFSAMNLMRYGVKDVVEFNQREFVSAYGSLSRIRHEQPWTPYVVIPREVLERAYVVSPAAAELRPYFDGPGTNGFEQVGCATYNIAPCDKEIRAGWFMWALRDAVAQAGHYQSAVEARAFYGRLTQEIAAACDDGRLSCLSPRATMVPPFRWDYLWSTMQTAGKVLHFAVTLQAMGVPRGPMSCIVDDCGHATQSQWPLFLDLVQSSVFIHAPWLPDTEAVQRRSTMNNPLPFQRRREMVARCLEGIIAIYRLAMPWVMGGASAAFIWMGFASLRRRRVEPLFVCASIAALVAVCRILLLAFLDVTAIPSVNSLYLSPAYPALLLFGATAILGIIRELTEVVLMVLRQTSRFLAILRG